MKNTTSEERDHARKEKSLYFNTFYSISSLIFEQRTLHFHFAQGPTRLYSWAHCLEHQMYYIFISISVCLTKESLVVPDFCIGVLYS